MHIALNAHLLSAASGYRKAGIHRYIYNLLHALPSVAPDATFTAMVNHHLEIDHPQFRQRVGFDTSRPSRRILWEQLIQPFALQQIQPDVYHASAFVMSPRLRVPSVVTIYDLSFERYPQVLSTTRRMYLQRFTRRSCERATRIIAISESTAQDMVDLWGIPREKIDISLVGVSPEFQPLDTDQISQFRLAKGLPERFVLFLGTLEPRKNLPMLLRAYAQLPAHVRNDLHLVLAGGKGWMFDDIFATITQHKLEETVHTPGFVEAEELVLWYNAADALVYPALYEGFGIPILEAMACGRLVAASNSSSLPEAIGDAGLLLPPHDEVAWRDTLQMIYDSDTTEPRHDAIAHASTFTWNYVAKQTVASYRQALS